MTAELDAQAAIEALQRRRVQNRLAQRNRRKRQAELEQKRIQERTKQRETIGERGNGEIDAATNGSGPGCTSTGVDGVGSGQTNRTQEPDMEVDFTIELNSNSPIEHLAVIAPHKLTWDRDGYASPRSDLGLSGLAAYDRLNETMATLLHDSELDTPRDGSTPKMPSLYHSPTNPSGLGSNPAVQQDSNKNPTRPNPASQQHGGQAQTTKCDVIRHPLFDTILPNTRTSVPTDMSTVTDVWDRGSLLQNYSRGGQGKTALHISAGHGDAGIVQFLLLHGVEVNRVDGWGRTPLHYAVRSGHVEIITQLLAAGADIEARDRHGHSPLHIAADAGSEVIIRLLAEEGADLDAPIDITGGGYD